jgi:SAM-dependent methyltransferase
MLRDDPAICVELARQAAELEEHYGADLISQPWPNPSRGAALLYYFQNNTHLCAGKDVLHIAPEPEPRAWLPKVARTYRTMDGNSADVDFLYDLTSIGLPDSSFDVVICHRVLEHVLDDIGAMRELHRVLRPAGLLNLSVPQATHREVTAEWVVPDESHHGHVRHYGRDLVSRLESAGFAVEVEPWLLARPRGALLTRNAYPMRMYNARRSTG